MAGDVQRRLKATEFYAGIGGFHYALKESGVFGRVTASIDINTNTTKVYAHNFPATPHLNRNICGLTAEELDQLEADIFFLSPPCQPFTRQGNQLDDQDRRTDSFFHLMHALRQMCRPPCYLLMENVKGFETSRTRDEFVEILKSLEYTVQEYLLSPYQFGIPNSRLRFYLLAKREPLKFAQPLSPDTDIPIKEGGRNPGPSTDAQKILDLVGRQLTLKREPGSCKTSSIPESVSGVGTEVEVEPERQRICEYLEEMMDDETLSRYLVPDKVLQRYAIALDIVQPSSQCCCCFTKGYGSYAVGTGSVLQHTLGKEELERAFLEYRRLQEVGNTRESVECLRGLNLRYFTPKEVANLMCFPVDFDFPRLLTDKQMYRTLGNSLNVKVVSVLIKYLLSDEGEI